MQLNVETLRMLKRVGLKGMERNRKKARSIKWLGLKRLSDYDKNKDQ